MSVLRYPILVEPLSSEDGGGFVALVPDLPGCMSDGASPEEAVANVKMRSKLGSKLRGKPEGLFQNPPTSDLGLTHICEI